MAASGLVDVPLAQTGEGIAECELLKWFVLEGEEVEEFQPLCEVQSDKATITITSRYKGKIAQVLYFPGDIVKVGETLLRIAVEGSESQATILASDNSQVPTVVHDYIDNSASACTGSTKGKVGVVLSTPAVRHLAKQYGVDVNDVLGTGKDGRVLKEDVLRYATQKGIIEDPSSGDGAGSQDQFLGNKEGTLHLDDTIVPLRGFQRTMVKTMSMAAKIPHFHYVEEINCETLVELKTCFQENNNDPTVKHTFLPLLVKSLSMALSKYPWMNSCFNEELMEVILKGLLFCSVLRLLV